MPIGDLLAEITGEKAVTAPPPSIKPSTSTSTSTGLKRKLNGDPNSNGPPNKAPKQSNFAPREQIQSSSMSKSLSASTEEYRPTKTSLMNSNAPRYTGTGTPGRMIQRPSTVVGPSSVKREAPDRAKNSGTLATTRIDMGKPIPTTPNTPVSSKAPKKGSFAEIMARGAKAQQIIPKAGTIQHKAINETVISKKERDDMRGKPKWKSTKATIERGTTPVNLKNTVIPGKKPGISRGNHASAGVKAKASRPNSSGSDGADKKVRKAATATTGYTGTARPPPKKPTDSRAGPSTSRVRPGGLLAPPQGRRDRYADDYDSELDDFIDDDDGEEDTGYGRRYVHYDSDGSSDMEAGADDIYMEETRAEREARLEDAREIALLEKAAREKEARKRRAGL